MPFSKHTIFGGSLGIHSLRWAHREEQAGSAEVARRLEAIIWAQAALEEILEAVGFPKSRFSATGSGTSAVLMAAIAAAKHFEVSIDVGELRALITARNWISHRTDAHDSIWRHIKRPPPGPARARSLLAAAKDLDIALRAASGSDEPHDDSGPAAKPARDSIRSNIHPFAKYRLDGIYVYRSGAESAVCVRFYPDCLCRLIRITSFDRTSARLWLRPNTQSTTVTALSGYISTEEGGLRIRGRLLQVRIPVPAILDLSGSVEGPLGLVDVSGEYVFDQDDPPDDRERPNQLFEMTRETPAITREILAHDSYKNWSRILIEAFRVIRSGAQVEQAQKLGEIPHAKRLIESMKACNDRMEIQTGFHLERLLEVLQDGRDQREPAWFKANYVTGSYDDW